MVTNQRSSVVLAALLVAAIPVAAPAQVSDDVVKIAVIGDMNGPYSAIGGIGVIRAVELAIKDFGGTVLGKPIEVVSTNYQLKVDVAATKAREWYDQEKVDLIIESSDSASAIAMNRIAAQKHKPIIFAGSATSALINKECSAYGIQWTYNTYALAAGTASSVVKGGGKNWYFLSADYAFGHAMERDAANVVTAAGGKVVGSSKHPLGSSDFASLLLTAQSSKADVVAFANAGKDAQNAIRQAAEFGLNKRQKLAAMLMFDIDIKGMGLQAAQGLLFTTAFYWDSSDETRAFAKRFYEVQKAMPTMNQAGAYSATLHYLKAIAARKTDDADKVLAQMRATPVNDVFAKNGTIREDGLHLHDMYLAEVKKPGESKGDWDIAHIRQTIPRDEAFPPLAASECPLVKKP